MSARDRHIGEVAATLRGRLVERRRAEAAAGRRDAPDLERTVRELVDEEAAVLTAASGLLAWAFMRETHPRPTADGG